jgi:hypothetical protein
MDRTRKSNRKGNEVTLQHQSRDESLRIEQLVEEKWLNCRRRLNS